VDLCIEHWRLSRAVAGTPAAAGGAARHALRRIGDILQRFELEAHSLDGQAFDAGLAVRVVHTEDDPKSPHDKVTIGETVSPMVLWRGNVVRPADVVTRRGTGG
jgi:molecular chaperone GrpE (heat shock protein)